MSCTFPVGFFKDFEFILVFFHGFRDFLEILRNIIKLSLHSTRIEVSSICGHWQRLDARGVCQCSFIIGVKEKGPGGGFSVSEQNRPDRALGMLRK